MDDTLFLVGASSGLMAVFAGGARAHILEKKLPRERLPMLEVGMRYQMMHSMGILWCWLAQRYFENHLPLIAGWVFVAGIVIFSGSMYTYALSGWRPALKLTPLGGVVFLIGWGCLIASGLR